MLSLYSLLQHMTIAKSNTHTHPQCSPSSPRNPSTYNIQNILVDTKTKSHAILMLQTAMYNLWSKFIPVTSTTKL